jgi:hypothetical protein
MVLVRETTKWTAPNHIYVLDDRMQNMIAYVPEGSNQVKKFRAPIAIDRRGRTFEPLEDPEPTTTVVVPGSKGQTYVVAQDGSVCSCPGFQFRSKCRHVAEIQQKNLVDKPQV